MSFTDIRNTGLTSKLPDSWKPYAILMRLDRPIGWWLLLLPGWWSIVLASGGWDRMSAWSWALMGLFWIGAVVMRGAGCAVNDLWDRNLDKSVERTASRPLASGSLSVKQAIWFLVILLGIGLSILLLLPQTAIFLGALSIPLIAAYPLMKRITFWPQAFLGLTFNFSALIGWAAVTDAVPLNALLLYAGCFFWTLGYDTIYAHQDKEDDMMAGIKSTALKFGRYSKLIIRAFYWIALILFILAFLQSGVSQLSLAILGAGGLHLFWQLHTWNPESQTSALRVFKSNRNFGLLILLAAFLF